jgi:hypothetical protein
MAQLPLTPAQYGIFIAALLLFAIPAGIISRRTGHSPWWGLLCLIPVAGLVGLWVLAFVRWPKLPQS